tara:strand:- start:85 stop:435 length:351 start_codon:yes stop_codon:yes gene_type:complete
MYVFNISISILDNYILRVVILQSMDDFDDDEWAEMQTKYVAYLLTEIPKIKAALNSKDCEVLRVFGHNIKGSGGMYGFNDITDIGFKMETLAKAENFNSLEAIVIELEKNINAKKP